MAPNESAYQSNNGDSWQASMCGSNPATLCDAEPVGIDIPPASMAVETAQYHTYHISVRGLTYKIASSDADARKTRGESVAEVAHHHSGPIRQVAPLEIESRRGSWGGTNKFLLKDVTCDAFPGELMAIAGPSGAGKSTLLDALAGRIRSKSLEGEININGSKVDSKQFRRITGYVMQDDALFPMLTVRETLMYSARLRLSGKISTHEKAQRVEDLIRELGLTAVANTRIGNANVRGVSGGERRRVSIGVDLVHNPPVLLLDEPTSGLDSCAALNIIEVLHDMAVHGKRTVLLSIHQPSFRILELFHNVLLLSQGSVVHCGSLEALEQRFHVAGEKIPPHVNALEYAIEVMDLQNNRKPLARFVRGKEPLTIPSREASLSMKLRSAVMPPGDRTSRRNTDASHVTKDTFTTRKSYGLEDNDVSEPHFPPVPVRLESMIEEESPLSHAAFACNPFQEIGTLSGRYCKNIFRTKELFTGRAVQVLVCGLCLGTLFLRVGKGERGIAERLGFLAFALSFLLTSATEALPLFLQEREVLIREASRGAYRISSYVTASTLVFAPFLLALALLFSVPAYWLVGFFPSTETFLFFIFVVWVLLLIANSVVACFAAVAPDYITANSMVAGLFGGCFLFSGYFIAEKYIPTYWLWAHYLSVFKYPFDALLVNEYENLSSVCFFTDPRAADVCLQTGGEYLQANSLYNHSKWMDVGIMVSFAALYRILCYVALRFNLKALRK